MSQCWHVFYVRFSLLYCDDVDLFFIYSLRGAILAQFWLHCEFISVAVILDVQYGYVTVHDNMTVFWQFIVTVS